jgi:hypothetical protein
VVRPFHQHIASMGTYTAAGNLDHQDSSTALSLITSLLAMSAIYTKAASSSFLMRARMWAADREARMYPTSFASTPGLQQRSNMRSHVWMSDDLRARNSGGFRRAQVWKPTRVSLRTSNSTQLLLHSLMVLFCRMAGVPNTPSASLHLSLRTTREQGAILKTNEETYILNALCPNAFGEYMRQYYKSWVQFGQDNYHSVDYNNLVIVTGVDLTRSCDMLAYAKDSSELHATFTVDASSLGSVSFGVWKDERHPGNLWPTSACDDPHTSSVYQTSAPTSMANDSSSPLPRQCVYLRGWRSRFRKAPTRIKGGAGPHGLERLTPSPESDSSGSSEYDSSGSSEYDSSGSSEYGAYYGSSNPSVEPEVDIVAISEVPPVRTPQVDFYMLTTASVCRSSTTTF